MGSISGLLTRNWTLKISAFGIALLLWVSVRAEAPNRQELSGVPVRVDLSDPRWTLVGDPIPTTVTVRFGGPARELVRMAVDRPSVVVPLESVMSGDTAVVLRNQWVWVQDRPGVVVEDIQPSSVRLTLEPIHQVSLPPALRWEGVLPAHLALTSTPIVSPAEIRVSGPRSRVILLDSVPVLPLNLSEISGSGRVLISVDTLGMQGLQIQPTSLQVELQVEDRIERVVSGIPVLLPPGLRDDPGLDLRPTTGSVVIRGARAAVERADPTNFELVVQVESGQLPEDVDEEATFPLSLVGLPEFVQGEPQQSAATIRRTSTEAP